LENLL